MTSVPSSTRLVASAMADRIVQHSWMPVVSPSNRKRRWSNTQTESSPASSAATATARMAGYDMIPSGRRRSRRWAGRSRSASSKPRRGRTASTRRWRMPRLRQVPGGAGRAVRHRRRLVPRGRAPADVRLSVPLRRRQHGQRPLPSRAGTCASTGADLEAVQALDGARPFEPMPGRPMTGFTILPPRSSTTTTRSATGSGAPSPSAPRRPPRPRRRSRRRRRRRTPTLGVLGVGLGGGAVLDSGASGRPDVLVHRGTGSRVVAALDVGQPLVGAVRIGGADPLVAFDLEEVRVDADVVRGERLVERDGPGSLGRLSGRILVGRDDRWP